MFEDGDGPKIQFKNKRLTEILQVEHFMIVIIPYINLFKPFLDKKISIKLSYIQIRAVMNCFIKRLQCIHIKFVIFCI